MRRLPAFALHDYLRVTTPVGPYDQHGVRVMFGVDVVQLTWLFIQAAAEDHML
jgi:hypothetical protein